jgi:hypothetical protein
MCDEILEARKDKKIMLDLSGGKQVDNEGNVK